MALKKDTTVNFEQESFAADTAVAEQPEVQTSPAVSASTAIAKAASSSVAVAAAQNFKKEVEAMKGAADFSYGAHRVFKFDAGEIKEMGVQVPFSLGRWAKVRLLAWDYSYQISPGDDSKGASVYVAYSTDGKTIDNVTGADFKSWEGKPVAEYVDFLKTVEGFTKASVRDFINTECALLDCEEAPEFRDVIQITLSSSSIPAFKSYQSKLEGTAKCVLMGLPGFSLPEDPFQFFWIRESASKDGKNWTKGKIVTTLPSKI